jgi:hypothetical protein
MKKRIGIRSLRHKVGQISAPEKEPQKIDSPEQVEKNPIDTGENEDTDKRIAFLSDESVSEIRWNRFKSEKNREIVRQLIKSEALRMGMVEKIAEEGVGLGFSEVCGIYNAATVGMVTAVTHCPPPLAKILEIKEEEQSAINVGGAADRICKKYLSTDFAYFDEIIVAIAIAPLMYTKFQMFKYAMEQWKEQKKAKAATSNVTPIRPPVPTVTSEGTKIDPIITQPEATA